MSSHLRNGTKNRGNVIFQVFLERSIKARILNMETKDSMKNKAKNAMNHEQLIEKNRQYYYYGATTTQIIKIFKVTFDKAVFKGTVSRGGFGF